MYRCRLEELRKEKGLSYKRWSEESGVSLDTITRIIHPENPDKDSPRVNTLEDLCRPLGVELWEIFCIEDKSLVALQAEMDTLASENGRLRAENDKTNIEVGIYKDALSTAQAENESLKNTLFLLKAENEVLNIKLEHKDEIIALHNYYNKINPNN